MKRIYGLVKWDKYFILCVRWFGMYGQYDSSDGSMDAMGLNVDKKMYKKSGIEFREEDETEIDARMKKEYEQSKERKGILQRTFKHKK